MVKKYIMDFPISLGTFSEVVNYILCNSFQKKSINVCIANVHMFIEARNNSDYQGIINNAEVVTPDGQPLIWALKFIYGIKQDRISGMDLLPALLSKMSRDGVSAYFYGGSEIMMKRTKNYLTDKFPGLKIAGFHSPPFEKSNSRVDPEVIESINSSSPSIVFVILGCPKQEIWMASMRDKIHTVMIGVGGALAVMIGMQKRAPQWMQKYGLEWLYRLYQEPRRLYKRYFYTNTLFVWIFFRQFIKVRIIKFLFKKNPNNLVSK